MCVESVPSTSQRLRRRPYGYAVSPASVSGRRAHANVFVYQPCNGCRVTPALDEWTNQPLPT